VARTEQDGRVALVTGARGGIGGAVAGALAGAGFGVLAVDREPGGADRAGVVPHVADLADDRAAAGAVATARDRFGRLDVVVCAHGGSGRALGDGPVDECSDDGWDATLDLNLRSVFLVCRHAVPALRRGGGGAIVTVASVLGLVGDRDFATHAYAASKGAVLALPRAMAASYGRDGIRVNAICPGTIRTRLTADIVGRVEQASKEGHGIPLGRVGEPEDIARCALFLASDDAAFISGAHIVADGGAMAASA
jgi:meso-butanediol dehydrogenase / (S,S)-butanediol dehydrogenase / diacetyl reductase